MLITYEDGTQLEATDNQAVFDYVAEKLLKQNETSLLTKEISYGCSVTGCQYRGSNGLKCAVGHLIPDNEYLPAMEGHSVSEIEADLILDFVEKYQFDRQLLIALQQVHDCSDPCDWQYSLNKVAHDFQLNSKAVEKFS